MAASTGDIRYADLFCGAGGAACGAWQAGATLVAGVDRDQQALETHAHNLPGEHIEHDLANVQPSILPPLRINWVHGSPPCQGFSQAKGDRDADDNRNQLVWAYVNWVDAINPEVATMENVSGMASITDRYMESVVAAFREVGYTARWKELNAADYGVPQTRKRIYVMAVRDDLPTPSRWFPRPTHAQTETMTLDGRRLDEWRTVRDAIGDLVAIDPAQRITSQQNEGHQVAGRRPYHRVTEPARTVRCGTPPKLVTPIEVPNHDPEPLTDGACDYLERNPQSLKKHRPNEPDEPARTIPANIARGVPYGLVRPPNHQEADHAPETRAHMARLEPGENDDSTTERRLHPDKPAGTMTASNSTPPIHYQGPTIPNHNPDDIRELAGAADDPSVTITSRGQLQDRNIGGDLSAHVRDIRRLTVREAARLQSFDDWFVFKGPKTSQLRQVGNAVPPRLQQHITAHVRTILQDTAAVPGGIPA